ncbi:MAG: neutral trehalase, partial [Methylobacteriaceae bacterium]|nr:neutral trehalase [Methylobacteriaceae bacterium]
MSRSLVDQARSILAQNDRGGYTVPTHGLYPFQWNWDSAFVSMGFATFDVDRGLRELERLAEGQWDDGMIPQIVFHAPATSYFPGPDVWGTRHRIATSGITQPPVFALALAFLARRAGDAHQPRLAKLYRQALAYHRWFATARDPERTGLVATLHNWETGRDNSPEWDAPFARVPETTTTVIRRRDTGHVDASMRPTDADYRRYIHLVDAYREVGWRPEAMWRVAPFKVADVGTNAILLAAEEALAGLAARFGEAGETAEIEARAAALAAGLGGLWSETRGVFLSKDLIAGQPIDVVVSAGFLPLLTSTPNAAQARRLCGTLESQMAEVALPAPSTDPRDPRFEPKRYWRGPVWAVVNWMIAEGLSRHGARDLADRLRRATGAAIARTGFC